MSHRIVCLPDLHMPFHSKEKLTRALGIIKYSNPTHIVQLGDLYDFYNLSSFARSLDIISPSNEISEGKAAAIEMWRIIKKYAPKSECFQILGNHDDRASKRIAEKCPEAASLMNLRQLWEFEGVKTVHDSREELIIDDIVFMHGFRTKLGDHAKYNFYKTVHGHTHRGGVFFFPVKGQMIWELDCGHLADPSHYALQYTQQRISNWTQGIGLIDNLGPRFVPL